MNSGGCPATKAGKEIEGKCLHYITTSRTNAQAVATYSTLKGQCSSGLVKGIARGVRKYLGEQGCIILWLLLKYSIDCYSQQHSPVG